MCTSIHIHIVTTIMKRLWKRRESEKCDVDMCMKNTRKGTIRVHINLYAGAVIKKKSVCYTDTVETIGVWYISHDRRSLKRIRLYRRLKRRETIKFFHIFSLNKSENVMLMRCRCCFPGWMRNPWHNMYVYFEERGFALLFILKSSCLLYILLYLTPTP